MASLIAVFRQHISDKFLQFINDRVPFADEHQLSLRTLFIFPSRLGFAFLVSIFVLWLIGTNYQNNLVIALVFFLLSIFIVAILHTFSNLVGLKISFNKVIPAFCSEDVVFVFSIKNQKKAWL